MNTQPELDTPESTPAEKQPLNLQVDIQNKSACERHVTVTVPREDIDRYFKQQFDELVPKAEVPGFRAGRAPRQFVENRFRKQISEQVKGSLLMDSLAQISEGQYFSAISEPDLAYDKVDVPEEGPMTFEFNIEVRPEFEMPTWKGIQLQRPEWEITPERVEEQLERLRKRNGVLTPVDSGVKLGDTIVANVSAKLGDKQAFENRELRIEVWPVASFADAQIQNFDKLLVGAKVGDSRETQVKVSEFAERAEFQSTTLDVRFDLLDVKRVEPQTDVQLCKEFGLESIGDIQDAIKSSLERQLAYEQRQSVRDQISRNLTETATWDLPPDLLRRQFRRELNRAVMEMRSSGFSDDEIRLRENALRQDVLRRTEVLLKEHFILERIAETEKIEDSPEDYERELAQIAESSRDSVRRVRARMERTGQMDVLRNMIIERKVLELIESNAKIESTKSRNESKGQVAAVDFAFGGEIQEHIPEAKYEDQQAAPIPGSAVQAKGSP